MTASVICPTYNAGDGCQKWVEKLRDQQNVNFVTVSIDSSSADKKADPIASHSRIFGYGSVSSASPKEDKKSKGLKAAYMSNSFAAYRYSAYEACGGFPEGLIFGEDMHLAAKMLVKDHKTYYAADAIVHNYTWE